MGPLSHIFVGQRIKKKNECDAIKQKSVLSNKALLPELSFENRTENWEKCTIILCGHFFSSISPS